MLSTKLFLARHGETEWSRAGRYQGYCSVLLSPEGERQAARLGERLAGEAIGVLHSSDLPRAFQTAQIIASRAGSEVRLWPELREMHFGAFEGKTFTEIAESHPMVLHAWMENPMQMGPPGGENLSQLSARVSRFLKGLKEGPTQERALVVSHGGPLRVMICLLLGLQESFYRRFQLDEASLSILEPRTQGVTLSLLNDRCHLNGL